MLMARFDAGVKEFEICGLNNENIIKECIIFDTKLKRVKYNYLDCQSEGAFQCDQLNIRSIIVDCDGNKSMAYLGKVAAQKGEINLEKCFQLRVPRQLVTHLENGTPITLDSGQIVQPADVFNLDQPEKRFFIFESSSVNFIKRLERMTNANDFLQRYHMKL